MPLDPMTPDNQNSARGLTPGEIDILVSSQEGAIDALNRAGGHDVTVAGMLRPETLRALLKMPISHTFEEYKAASDAARESGSVDRAAEFFEQMRTSSMENDLGRRVTVELRHLQALLASRADAPPTQNAEAWQLLHDIRDGKVNPEDEADKFLRAFPAPDAPPRGEATTKPAHEWVSEYLGRIAPEKPDNVSLCIAYMAGIEAAGAASSYREQVAVVERKFVHGHWCVFINRTPSDRDIPDGMRLYAHPSPPPALPVAQGSPNWFCPKCEVEVPPKNVTFEENHDVRAGGCGGGVLPNAAPALSEGLTASEKEGLALAIMRVGAHAINDCGGDTNLRVALGTVCAAASRLSPAAPDRKRPYKTCDHGRHPEVCPECGPAAPLEGGKA